MQPPEAPSQPQMPGSPDGTVQVPDPAATAGVREPASNGHAQEGAEASADDAPSSAKAGDTSTRPTSMAAPSPEGAQAADVPAAEGESKQGPDEKKRRRRRRRKKAGVSGPSEGSTEETPETDAADGDADGGVEIAAQSDKAERRPERKEKKARPPRERPPVNLGDIVFGKILEITEEAILIDIPGKARAIFDRRELLLPDDDEEERRSPNESATRAQVSSEASPPEDPGAALDPSSEEPEAVAAQASDPVPESAVAEPSSSPVPPEAELSLASQGSDSAPAKEPKVPRVVLEPGTDFIGVVHGDGARGGLVVLTHHPRRADKTKAIAEKALADKSTVEGLVTGVIKGGVEVDVEGLRAFAPGSQVDLRMGADLSYLVGQRLPFFVTQYAKRGRDVVLSRRSMIEEEARKARTEALASLKIGEETEGVVRSVVSFGAFVDVGGIEGLVPLHEMSHNRSDGPSDVFKAGDNVKVKIVKIDDRGKVWLSRKATIPDPWQQVALKYAMGTRHTGKVVRIQPFGAFIELEAGVDGLIHTQDLSIKRIETPEEVIKAGDAIEVVVAHLDATQHKIGLHPALQGETLAEATQRVVIHKPVKAKVVTVESGGLVVRILGVTGRNARGYVTAAATGTPRGTELRKAFTTGQELEAKVIELDPRRGEVKLSIKALSEEQERSAYQQYRQQLKAEAKFTFGDLLAKKGNPHR
jgi:small subunit ribosomal protein S1